MLLGLAGPMLSPESVTGGEKKLIGSMFLIEAQKIEEVREKIETDVYWRTGVVSSFDILFCQSWLMSIRPHPCFLVG